MQLSIVSTLYQSAPYLNEFIERIAATAASITEDYEIILVNDGSPDDSVDMAIGFHENDARVKVIDLSRNFGHHRAVMTGLSFTSGRYVFLIDCDLEEDPELLQSFYETITHQDSVDVYFGVQIKRKGSLVERFGGDLFYRLFNRLSKLNLPRGPLTIRIMTARYVQALTMHSEEELFLAGLFESTGFVQKQIEVNKKAKPGSTYSIWKRLQLFVTGITSFSSFPLLVSFYVGSVISFSSIAYAVYLFTRKLLNSSMLIEGWTSVMISIWFLGGAILISCGMIGIYLSRVYYEVKRRPKFIVKQFYGIDKEPHA